METRASYLVIGTFVLAALLAAFGFVYWLQRAGGLGERTVYRVRFEQPVAGLSPGSAVLFNGIRIGEVTALRIEPDRPTGVMASIAVDAGAPVRSDTAVDVDYQGLTGIAAISLKGGSASAAPLPANGGETPILHARTDAGQSLPQAARETLRQIDDIVGENRKSLSTAISGLGTFADMLARNSDRIEGVLGGLERMTGGGTPATAATIYDLAAAADFPTPEKQIEGRLAVPDPAAVLVFDSQKILVRTPEGTYSTIENAQWADNLPKLMQAKIVQSFENAGQLRAVGRRIDEMNASHRLALEIRSFEISPAPTPTAVVELAARLLGDDGKVLAARIFKATAPTASTQMSDALPALNKAWSQIAKDLVTWTVSTL